MKRSCMSGERWCKALEINGRGRYTCMLGYKMKQEYLTRFGVHVDPKPAEECPKPMTNDLYYSMIAQRLQPGT